VRPVVAVFSIHARRGVPHGGLIVFCKNTKHNESEHDLLCEASIDIVIDLGDLVLGIDGDGRLLLLGDLGESSHYCFVCWLVCIDYRRGRARVIIALSNHQGFSNVPRYLARNASLFSREEDASPTALPA